MTAPQHVIGTATPLLEAVGLRIESRISGRQRTIVTNLDLRLAAGETVGIVGESGSGKSMTARALIGLLPGGLTAQGEVLLDGRDVLQLSKRELARVRGREIALVMQDPFTMLNPVVRCGQQVMDVWKDGAARLSRHARRDEAIRRLSEVGIPDVVDRYPFELSGGMRQRVAIAAALAGDPRVLIADEPSTALDVTTQAEILALLKSLQESRSMGLILITHDLRVAFSSCDRLYVLYAGSLLEVGDASEVEAEPLHPYTLGLLLSEPPADRRLSELVAIPGKVAEVDEVAGMCPLSPRCQWAQPRCTDGDPPLITVVHGRRSACVRLDEIRPEMRRLRAAGQASAGGSRIDVAQEPLISVQGLTKVYADAAGRKARASVTALDDVSIVVGAGESVGLVGQSGSGKTTLARCLVGLETATSGAITIDGIAASDFSRLSDADLRRLRRTVQIVFQDPYSSLNPLRTVGATLQEAVALDLGRGRDTKARVQELLERVGLPGHYVQRKPVALSGGERQRVAIARALAVRPRLIICDEPVSALDVSVQAQILSLFRSLRTDLGVGYLFITHDLAVVRQVVERIYVLHRGTVVESGPVGTVLDDPQHAYTAQLVDSVPRSPGQLAQSGRRAGGGLTDLTTGPASRSD
ncbi:MAG: ABC transporter ATP-binding protein [Actinomycetota bacterium]|nr:ABC transporter ATP-binding protein [Actinomycetota bacterium]